MSELDLGLIEQDIQDFLNYPILPKSYQVSKDDRKYGKSNPVLDSYQNCMAILSRTIDYIRTKPEVRNLMRMAKNDPENKERYKAELDKYLKDTRKLFNKHLDKIKVKLRLYKKTYYLGRNLEDIQSVHRNLLWMSIYILRRHLRDIWRGILIKGGDDIIQKYREKFSRVSYFDKPKGLSKGSEQELEDIEFNTPDMLEESKKVKIRLILNK